MRTDGHGLVAYWLRSGLQRRKSLVRIQSEASTGTNGLSAILVEEHDVSPRVSARVLYEHPSDPIILSTGTGRPPSQRPI